jgi:hypothetical protein
MTERAIVVIHRMGLKGSAELWAVVASRRQRDGCPPTPPQRSLNGRFHWSLWLWGSQLLAAT